MNRQLAGYIEKAPQFFAEVSQCFAFLETQYGFRPLKGVIDNQAFFGDACAVVTYVSPTIGVRLAWEFSIGFITAGFIELQESGVYPERGTFYLGVGHDDVPHVISLYTLLEFLGHKHDPSLLLMQVVEKRLAKQIEKQNEVMHTNMHGVLVGLAQAMQSYAADILTGNTAIFLDVMRLETEKDRQLRLKRQEGKRYYFPI